MKTHSIQQTTSKLVPIIRGRKTANPRVVGWVLMWWCNSLGRYVTIPK